MKIFDKVKKKINNENNEKYSNYSNYSKKLSTPKKIFLLCIIAIIFIYLIGVLFLNNSFSQGTKINGISVSGYTSQGALVKIKSSMEYHKMKIHFGSKSSNHKTKDVKKYDDVEVSYITLGASFNNKKALSQINQIKAINKWFWPVMMFNDSKDYSIEPYDFDESVLKKTIKRIPYFNQETNLDAKNAYISYSEKIGRYVIVPEQYGTNVDITNVYDETEKIYSTNNSSWNVNESSLYQKPEITSDNENLNKMLKFANENLNSTIIYKFNNEIVAELSPKTMIDWFDVSGQSINSIMNSEASKDNFLKSKINDFIDKNLFQKCEVTDKMYSYQSSNGVKTLDSIKKTLPLDKAKETTEIYNDLINNISQTKEPSFKNLSESNEQMTVISGDYIEIDRNKEILNIYSNDTLINSCSIKTKNDLSQNIYYVSKKTNNIFDGGLYCLSSKKDNVSLNIEVQSQWIEEISEDIDVGTPVVVY